jgi:transposase-like protein
MVKNAGILLPMVELIESSRVAVDELIDVLGRASIEAVLELSAMGVAGEKHRGRRGGEIGWHGSQKGTVQLSERRVRVSRPRLRRKGKGKGKEVEIPAYEAINANEGIAERVLEILMRNVSTREYRHVISEMAETVGVSKSSISREFIEQSAKQLEHLMQRRFDTVELLIIYLDGLVFGDHHVICALGVTAMARSTFLGWLKGPAKMGLLPLPCWRIWWGGV